jgi:hypothetical protein
MRAAAAICPSCGRPIVPDGVRLSPTQRKILDAVQRRGEICSRDLRYAVWGNDPDGGPESFKTLAAHVHFLNQRLSAHGLMVRAGRGAGAVYSLRRAAR